MNFSSINLGIDIATSLAVVASAVTFLYKQKKISEQDRAQKLDGTVRTVAAEQLQEAIHALSQHFMMEVVRPLQRPQNIVNKGVEKIESMLSYSPEIFGELKDDYAKANAAMDLFLDMAYARRYQIIPLLDTLGAGKKEIDVFKSCFDELINGFNETARSVRSLRREVEEILSFCAGQPYESLDDEGREGLVRMAASIVCDPDYRNFVNTFIPDEDIEKYWHGVSKNDVKATLVQRVILGFIGFVYEKPNRLRATVVYQEYIPYQKNRVMCKKFLIMLAAINHTLLCRPGSEAAKESPSATADRYAGDEFFALEREVR